MIVPHALPAVPSACLQGLPPAPRGLSSAIALDAGCALVVLEPGGRVRLAPRPRIAITEGAQVARGEGVTWRAGHVVLVRAGRVLWRSSRAFPHRPGTFTVVSTAALGQGRLAYEVSRWSGRPRRQQTLVFVTQGGPERLLPTTAFPFGWTPRGLVTADGSRSSVTLRIWRADGRPATSPRTLATGAWVWDWSTNRLFAASRGRLVGSDGASVTPVASLRSLGFEQPQAPSVAPLGDGLIEVSTSSRVAVVDGSGRTIARARLPRGWRLGGALAATPAGALAFEATPSVPLPARRFRLYAALPGRVPEVVDRYSLAPSCGAHGLWVRGSTVLLTGTGIARAYDLRRAGTSVDLEPAVRFLRAHGRTGQPSFARDA